jgi:hypothetical protein
MQAGLQQAAAVGQGASGGALAWMARIGLAARGVVFLLIGVFAGLAAFGSGRPVGTRGVLEKLFREPLGEVLLWAIAAGIFCFALWRVVEATFDPNRYGSDMGGLARRAGLIGSALVHLAIAGVALSVIWGVRGDDDQAARDWTAWLLARPFGQVATLLVGVAIAVAGIARVRKPVRLAFRKQLELTAASRRWVIALGLVGFTARAAILVLVGGFLVIAALRFNSGDAAGLAGALRALQRQPYGAVLLGLMAFGLCAFGLFQFAEAAWLRIPAPKLRELAMNATRGSRSR